MRSWHLPVVLLFSLFVALLGPAALTAAPAAHLVEDIDPGFKPFDPQQGGRVFYDYTAVNGRVVFLSQIGAGDFQCGLWVTDGAAGALERLTDFCGVTPGGPQFPRMLAALAGGRVALLTDAFGRLWRTDGTAAGTFSLGDVRAEALNPGDARLGPDGRTLFFKGCTLAQGCEPWRSDGTREGTWLLGDLRPGSASSGSGSGLLFTPWEARLLFSDGGGLWVTNGTRQGTVQLVRKPGIWQIQPHRGAIYFLTGSELWVLDRRGVKPRRLRSFRTSSSLELHEAGGRLLTVESNEDYHSVFLWGTDGTPGGTRRLGPDFEVGLRSIQIASVGERAVFAAGMNVSDEQKLDLWFLDPAMKTPRRLRGCPGGCPRPSLEGRLVPFGGRLFFAARDAAHGLELWTTDGTPQGTRLVKDLCPGVCDGTPASFHPALGRLLFEDAKNDLWATDGTAAGTVRIGPLPYPEWYRPETLDIAEEDGRIFFTSLDPVNGAQPWVSDLTPEGTEPILGIGGSLAASSEIRNITHLGGRVLFMACDGASRQLWASDGTAAGTVPLPGPASTCQSPPNVKIEIVNGLAFFLWDAAQLWRTDGTPAGTVLLEDPGTRLLRDTTPFGDKLLFVLDPEGYPPTTNGWLWDFWTTDGSPQSTREVFQMRFGGTPGRPTPAGGYALFVAQKAVSPFSITLFRTDGTEAGTQPILEVYDADSRLYLGPEVARIGGRTFFLAEGLERRLGFELWVTDGTAAGTTPVISDPNASRPRQLHSLTVFEDALYFTANTGNPAQPRGIWRSDGTAAGTRLLKAFGSQPQDVNGNTLLPTFTPAGDRLFFRLDDGVHGTELWRTDGTPEGTALVRDIAPGPKDGSITSLAAAGGKVYFSATDGEHGLELWESDGTAAGTRLVQDIAPGTASSNPEQLVATGDKLFFTADDGAHGRELWELPLP
jgi:ELWxxDGT repeat protein